MLRLSPSGRVVQDQPRDRDQPADAHWQRVHDQWRHRERRRAGAIGRELSTVLVKRLGLVEELLVLKREGQQHHRRTRLGALARRHRGSGVTPSTPRRTGPATAAMKSVTRCRRCWRASVPGLCHSVSDVRRGARDEARHDDWAADYARRDRSSRVARTLAGPPRSQGGAGRSGTGAAPVSSMHCWRR